LYRVGLEYILGLKLAGDVMYFDPCIPSSWKEYKLTYKRAGTVYNVVVINPESVQKGVKRVEVDGQQSVDGRVSLAPAAENISRTVSIRVVMG
jgi:cellobiose phosphorylase